MLAVNPPTQMLLQYLEHCRDNSDGVFTDPALHPYFMSLAVAKAVGMDHTTEEYKERALSTLANWSRMLCGQLTSVSMREIADCGKFAQDSGDRKGEKMAKDLLDSMPLIQAVFKSWDAAVDHEHIAEWIYEDGVRREKEGTAPHISNEFVAKEKKKLDDLFELIQKKLGELDGSGPQPEEVKSPEPARPPVTPADIMKMLFDNAKKPSAN